MNVQERSCWRGGREHAGPASILVENRPLLPATAPGGTRRGLRLLQRGLLWFAGRGTPLAPPMCQVPPRRCCTPRALGALGVSPGGEEPGCLAQLCAAVVPSIFPGAAIPPALASASALHHSQQSSWPPGPLAEHAGGTKSGGLSPPALQWEGVLYLKNNSKRKPR